MARDSRLSRCVPDKADEMRCAALRNNDVLGEMSPPRGGVVATWSSREACITCLNWSDVLDVLSSCPEPSLDAADCRACAKDTAADEDGEATMNHHHFVAVHQCNCCWLGSYHGWLPGVTRTPPPWSGCGETPLCHRCSPSLMTQQSPRPMARHCWHQAGQDAPCGDGGGGGCAPCARAHTHGGGVSLSPQCTLWPTPPRQQRS